MLYTKNRLFAKYGHECEITYTVNELPMFIPGTDFKTKFARKIVRMRMASEINRRGNYYLRSQAAIADEHYKHLKYLYMIHPFSDFRTLWEIFMMVVFLLQFVTIPINILSYILEDVDGFEATGSFIAIKVSLDILCLIDCGMNFITGYYDMTRKEVVLEPKKVARQYLLTYFLFDVISSIPAHFDDIFPITDQFSFLRVLFYASCLKSVRYSTFRMYCKHFGETFNWSYLTSKIFTSIVSFLLYFHIVCCLFLYMYGKHFFMDTQMIYSYSRTEKKVISTGYFHTLYITTLVICTAGYGTEIEFNTIKAFVIAMWVISKFFYIMALAVIICLVISKTSATHKYLEIVHQLKEYMRYKQLPEYMQRRLIQYYEFKYQKSFFNEEEILRTISGALRQDISLHNCRKLVENVEFFKSLPSSFLVHIATCLKVEVFLTNDVIVRANTTGDSMYFISSGTVAVYTKCGKEVCHLEDGAYFGEVAMVMANSMRIASVIAVEICELFRLDRSDFNKAVYPYPDLMNKVRSIACDRLEMSSIVDEHYRVINMHSSVYEML